MNVLESVESILDDAGNAGSVTQNSADVVIDLAQKLDFLDIQLLRKFYATGKNFPFDTQPYCFPILFKEMKESKQLNIGIEALRKRLDNLIKIGLLDKIHNSNPTNYYPINGKESLVRSTIMKFFLINGLTKFL